MLWLLLASGKTFPTLDPRAGDVMLMLLKVPSKMLLKVMLKI